MKDAFERRALLLHLGDALQAISVALAAGAKHHTLHHLLNAHPDLASHAWLTAIAPKMKTADFAARASASFAAWPALLLEEQVHYGALALAVHDTLFADNHTGWLAYVDAMKREVEWFGDGLPYREATEAPLHEAEVAQATQESDTSAENADVERAEMSDEPQRDSIEGNERLYPSWPWKPGI